MSLTLAIELNEQDLAHFRDALEPANKAAAGRTEEEIISAAASLLENAQKVRLPDFIRQRLERRADMIAMVRDEGGHLDEEDRRHILHALVYFAVPKDVNPADVEVLSFLDDAIMVELCVREVRYQ